MSTLNERIEKAQAAMDKWVGTGPYAIADIKTVVNVFADALKEPPRIVTNICDECQRPFYRDPTPEEIEKYKEPNEFSWSDTDRETAIVRASRLTPEKLHTPFGNPQSAEPTPPPVRNPDGRVWRIFTRDGEYPEGTIRLYPEFGGFAVTRPMTPAEAFRVGALVRYTDPTNPKLMEQNYITRVEKFDNCDDLYQIDHNGDVSYGAEVLTLVEPAPEEK